MPFRRAPSCATGPRTLRLRPGLRLPLQPRHLALLRRQPVLQVPHRLDRPLQIGRDRQAPFPRQPPEPLAQLPKPVVQLPPRESQVQLSLPELGPVDDPIPETDEELAYLHLKNPCASAGQGSAVLNAPGRPPS